MLFYSERIKKTTVPFVSKNQNERVFFLSGGDFSPREGNRLGHRLLEENRLADRLLEEGNRLADRLLQNKKVLWPQTFGRRKPFGPQTFGRRKPFGQQTWAGNNAKTNRKTAIYTRKRLLFTVFSVYASQPTMQNKKLTENCNNVRDNQMQHPPRLLMHHTSEHPDTHAWKNGRKKASATAVTLICIIEKT